jgi:hypothetical protein
VGLGNFVKTPLLLLKRGSLISKPLRVCIVHEVNINPSVLQLLICVFCPGLFVVGKGVLSLGS